MEIILTNKITIVNNRIEKNKWLFIACSKQIFRCFIQVAWLQTDKSLEVVLWFL